MTQAINDGFYSQQALQFLERNDVYNRWGNVIGSYLMLPGLRGFWPGSTVGPGANNTNAGALVDISGLRNTLTPINAPVFGSENLIPYVDYDGTNHFQIGDLGSNNAFDIIGNEAYISDNGLSIGCWARFDNTAAANEICMAKLGGSGAFAYALFRRSDGTVRFEVSTDGTNLVTVTSIDTVPADTWVYLAGTFEPSTELKVWINSDSWSETTGVPATIFNTATVFTIGTGVAATLFMDGQMNMNWITATLLSDSFLLGLYEQTKVLFGHS